METNTYEGKRKRVRKNQVARLKDVPLKTFSGETEIPQTSFLKDENIIVPVPEGYKPETFVKEVIADQLDMFPDGLDTEGAARIKGYTNQQYAAAEMFYRGANITDAVRLAGYDEHNIHAPQSLKSSTGFNNALYNIANKYGDTLMKLISELAQRDISHLSTPELVRTIQVIGSHHLKTAEHFHKVAKDNKVMGNKMSKFFGADLTDVAFKQLENSRTKGLEI